MNHDGISSCALVILKYGHYIYYIFFIIITHIVDYSALPLTQYLITNQAKIGINTVYFDENINFETNIKLNSRVTQYLYFVCILFLIVTRQLLTNKKAF